MQRSEGGAYETCQSGRHGRKFAAGCGDRRLRQSSAESKSAIRAAEEAGSINSPSAAYHLQLAKEEVARAEALAAKGEKEQAASLLTRAEADAELAIALSHEQNEKTEAANAMERVRKLREENQLPIERSNP
jgi:uncharacterized protein YaiL (DUF2058 family)